MFIDRRGPSITPADVGAFEAEHRVQLPDDYRAFLLSHNGGVPRAKAGGSILAIYFFGKPHTSADVRYLLGLREEYSFSLTKMRAMFRGRIPEEYLPIGSTSGGDLYLLLLAPQGVGQVSFWDHENEAPEGAGPWTENVVPIAPSFSEFLNRLEVPRHKPF